MEFRFDIKPLFTQPIIRITNHMLPQNFRGDRRMAANTAQQVSEIVDAIGEHSAKAQGLSKAVTTSNKLRQSEQKLYLLADVGDGKRGSVIGMLKVGEKALYIFDENGETKKVDAPCILDFYIHESRQRAGLGKDLFQTMLKEENWQPAKLAIDRPSDKLLGFLRKHYNLDKTIPQMNNFVIYDGFFDGQRNGTTNDEFQKVHITSSPNTALFGPYRSSDDKTRKLRADQQASYYSPVIQNTPIGRYAAQRPLGSMSEQNACYSNRRQVTEKRSGLQAINDRMEYLPKYSGATGEVRRAGLDSKRTYMYAAPGQIANRVIENQTRLIAQNQLSNENTVNAANINPSEPLQSNQNQYQYQAIPNNMPQQYIQNQPIPQQYIQNQGIPPQYMQNQAIPQQYNQNSAVQQPQQYLQNQSVPQNQTNQEQSNQQQQAIQQKDLQQHIQNQMLNPNYHQNQAAVPPIINGPIRQTTGESNSNTNDDQQSTTDEIESVRIEFENLNTEPELVLELEIEPVPDNSQIDIPDSTNDGTEIFESVNEIPKSLNVDTTNRFHRHNKQHTGMKNLSSGVGAAVTPTNKMEFYQENPESFGIVKINHPVKSTYTQSDDVSVVSVGSGDGYTRQGHYDLKFHHNTLW